MVNSIRENRQPQLGGAAALTSLECVAAVYESHFTGTTETGMTNYFLSHGGDAR